MNAAMLNTETLVFVYGTLLHGELNHGLLAGARYLGAATTKPEFTLVDLGRFPGMIGVGHTGVQGELYAVDGDTLAALDRLEGHPHFYARTPIVLADGREVETYVLPASYLARGRKIAGGDWRAHVQHLYAKEAL